MLYFPILIPFLTYIYVFVYLSIHITFYSAGEIELFAVLSQYCDASWCIES